MMFIIEPALLIYDENLTGVSLDDKVQKSFKTIDIFNKNKALKELSVPITYLELIMKSAPMNRQGFKHYGQLSLYFSMILTMLDHDGSHSEKKNYRMYKCSENFVRKYMDEYSCEVEQSLVDCFFDKTSKIITEEKLNSEIVEVQVDEFSTSLNAIYFDNLDSNFFPYFIPSPKHSYMTNSNRGGRNGVSISILCKEDEEACYFLIKDAIIYEESKKDVKDRFAYNIETNNYLRFVTTDNKKEFHAFPVEESYFSNKMYLKRRIDEKYKK